MSSRPGTTTEPAPIGARCQGKDHAARVGGHAGPARYAVHSRCPRCGWEARTLMCAGRVDYVRTSAVDFRCPACPAAAVPWSEFWTITDLKVTRFAETRRPVADPPAARADYVERFCRELAARRARPRTITARRYQLRRLEAAHPDLAAVSADELDEYLRGLVGYSAAYHNATVSALRVFYGWMLESGAIVSDPTRRLRRARRDTRPPRVADEASVLEAAAAADAGTRAMLLLGLLGGLRLGEITRLHGRDRAGGWLTINGKGGKVRRIKEPGPLRAALDALDQDGYLFPGRRPGTHLDVTTVSKRIREATGYNPHALRHAAGTALYDETKDLRLTQDYLGHTDPRVTTIYTHISDARMTAAADTIAARARSTVAGRRLRA